MLRDYVGYGILTVPIRDPHLEDVEANRVGERVRVMYAPRAELLHRRRALVGPARQFDLDLQVRLTDSVVVHLEFDQLPEGERTLPLVVDERGFVAVAELFAEVGQEGAGLARVEAVLPLSATLGAMAVVGLGTTVQAARQPLPSAAGAVVAGVAAVLIVVAGVSAGLQTLFATPPSGQTGRLVRQGSMVLAALGLLAGAFAAAMSLFFWKRSRRRLETSA